MAPLVTSTKDVLFTLIWWLIALCNTTVCGVGNESKEEPFHFSFRRIWIKAYIVMIFVKLYAVFHQIMFES